MAHESEFLDRRRFNLALLSTAASISTGATQASAGGPGRQIIDVHSHFLPPELKAATHPAPPLMGWDLEFAELDRRRAIVYVHPIAAACCAGIISEFSDAMIEYQTDTTRAIASYVYRGAARRFPNVRMIWSHAGGTMPYLIERFDVADQARTFSQAAPEGFRAAVAKFHYDIAQSSNPVATTALRQIIPVDHILFGTDYPFRTPREHVSQLESAGVFSKAELTKLYRGNIARDFASLMA